MTWPGGKPVTALPGLTPRSARIVLGPVLVTVEAPRTAKLDAAPSGGAVCCSGLASLTSSEPPNINPLAATPARIVRNVSVRNWENTSPPQHVDADPP